MAQVVEKPAIGQALQAIGRHGRSRDIAAEALEAAAIAGGDVLGVDAVAAPGEALDDAPHLVIVRKGPRSEAHARLAVALVDTVEHELVRLGVVTQGGSPMRSSRTSGSVREAPGHWRPYRDT